jgi:hypothetical protein
MGGNNPMSAMPLQVRDAALIGYISSTEQAIAPSTFESFVDDAIRLASAVDDNAAVTDEHPLLNGVPYSVFRRAVSIETRREIGAFFTSDVMASALARKLADRIDDNALVLDPTCGIGDLLLARAAILPLGPTLSQTLALWGDRLAGFDTREDLVRLTKVRLCMLARARGAFTGDIDLLDSFPLLQAADMSAPESQALLERADAVLFNPPFGKTTSDKTLTWAGGEINAAAIFLDHLTGALKPSTPIAAVLPEVLRCGSRYRRFRAMLTARGYVGDFEAQGRFDPWTDVDVFTTLLTRSTNPGPLWRATDKVRGPTIEDLYEVRVGTVVPHRDPKSGDVRAYICAKTTPAWNENFIPQTRLAHPGRAFTPPFVAIRRTSSPSDRLRAVGTIVTGREPVLVENHLLVAAPKDASLAACEALLKLLRTQAVNDHLNDLMRCRHLTTGAIKSVPWPKTKASVETKGATDE